MSEDRFEDLLGPYLLGGLSTEEEREMEAHLRRCPRCQTELEEVRRAHDSLLQAAATGAPPPDLKGWVLARARGEARDEGGNGARAGRKLWIAAAAAALLVAAVLGVGVLRAVVGDPSEGLPLTATSAAPGASGELRGEEIGQNLRVELEVRGLPELQEGEYYEMWYARKDGTRISCGTFDVSPGGDATVIMSAPTHSVSYPEVEVTREPADGDPTTSGDEMLVGDLRDA